MSKPRFTAQQLAAAVLKADDTPTYRARVPEPQIWDSSVGEKGGFRPLTQGELTKAKRYLSREDKRKQFRTEQELAEAKAEDRAARKERQAEAAAKLKASREALKGMMPKAV